VKYTVETESGAMIYIPSFMNIGSGIQNIWGDNHADTQRGS
jgi:hypothetical protein